ncbi:hypothetical protein K402DRAFT_393093 [Aulographum hederae CBS 113979]|uniref:Metallo-beta-lactamase domain-containing protein n=1 Tax=Aulographum hederae CBS 113979 TaxID=1176131 RepID=A0A6G1H1U3_9PEZI|nr:hypothetical protein K402DRAFT_393093 [Aulographum hederae CBS 113979]
MASEPLLASPLPAPPLNTPKSTSTVKVSCIDNGAHIETDIALFMEPPIEGHTRIKCPAFSWLIQHPTHGNILFDLSVRKDWENLVPGTADMIKSAGWDVGVPKDVHTILEEHGVSKSSIKAIIWSHYHFDHTGDPSVFPPETELVVGPGFKDNILPGYPAKKDSPILESDYTGRNLREISFSSSLQIGRFKAFDLFGDGSFFLLDTPGHTIGHMCGLARVTSSSDDEEDTFVLMGGDACHHSAQYRPSPYRPLPASISPSPFPGDNTHIDNTNIARSICPGAFFQDIQRNKRADEPFYLASDKISFDVEKARWTADGLQEFDADENVLVGIAHDAKFLGVVDMFPEDVGGWKEKGWGEKLRWRFLADFEGAVKKE